MTSEIDQYFSEQIATTEPAIDGSITLTTHPGVIWEHFSTISEVQQYVARLAVRHGRQGSVIDQGDVVVIHLS